MARQKPKLKLGVITDIHFGIDTGAKLGSKAPQLMQAFMKAAAQSKPAFIVDMGDRVSSRNAESDRQHMESLMQHFNALAIPTYHVAGNHDVHHLSREENFRITGKSAESYSFDQNGFHFVIWNPHVTKNGIHLKAREEDLEWLKNDLNSHPLPTIVFSHGPLYPEKILPPTLGIKSPFVFTMRNQKISAKSWKMRAMCVCA